MSHGAIHWASAALFGTVAVGLAAAGVASLRGLVTPYRDYEPYAPSDETAARRLVGGGFLAMGLLMAGVTLWVTGVVDLSDRMGFSAVAGGVGLLVVGAGVAVRRGHRYLLANYVAELVDENERVDRVAGGAIAAVGLVWVALAVVTAAGVASASSLPLLAGVVVATLALAGVAAASIGRL
jgi:hypothetical protein